MYWLVYISSSEKVVSNSSIGKVEVDYTRPLAKLTLHPLKRLAYSGKPQIVAIGRARGNMSERIKVSEDFM